MRLPAGVQPNPALFGALRSLQAQGIPIPENPDELIALLQERGFVIRQSPAAPAAEEEPEQVLESLDLNGVASHIRNGSAQKIIVMVGAGLSTAAGIPDFRTPGTGLYDNLQKYDLPRPEAIFSLDFFRESPGAFYELIKDMWPGNYKPTKAHYFIKLLQEKGLLKRCYTQNIDSLEELAGVDRDLIVAAHGNFASAHGIDTGTEVPIEEVRIAVEQGPPGWYALKERHDELVKPAIVFFGESLPERFTQLIRTDFRDCDLLIVMGTSLVVAPFCKCITLVSKACPRLLINREPAGLEATGFRNGFRLSGEASNYRDAYFCGDCDEGVEVLCKELGWTAELKQLIGEEEIGPEMSIQTSMRQMTQELSNRLSCCECFSGLFRWMRRT